MSTTEPTRQQIARWRRYLANERAEAAVYRELAAKRTGEERDILLQLADAESRHEKYWRERLGIHIGQPRAADMRTRTLGFFARHFGSVFALALMQTAETRTPYEDDVDAPDAIAADEALHSEVVRALATKGRERISGGFRAAVFGANDGLVSNVALVLGVLGSGMSSNAILLTGISGLLAGALSMAAGEYVSVRSQAELLDASTPAPEVHTVLDRVDVDANELALVYRARGMDAKTAEAKAAAAFLALAEGKDSADLAPVIREDNVAGSAWAAAGSSFFAFSIGALIPIIPFMFGVTIPVAVVTSLVMVSIALLITGGITGLLSGKAPAPRAFRQLAIGLGAAATTYLLGIGFGALIS